MSNLTVGPLVHRTLNSVVAKRDISGDTGSMRVQTQEFEDLDMHFLGPPEEAGLAERDIEVIPMNPFGTQPEAEGDISDGEFMKGWTSPQGSAEKDPFEELCLVRSPFENLCWKLEVQEEDLEQLRSRLTHYDTLVALYNDFDGQKRSVQNIKGVFAQVFTELSSGYGFEGNFRVFFKEHIDSLSFIPQIKSKDRFELWGLAEPAEKDPQIIRDAPGNRREPQSGPSYLRERQNKVFHKSGGRKALEDKGWLAAAMVLGLMASYPLILKPMYQVTGDLVRRMRGISVPKVQG